MEKQHKTFRTAEFPSGCSWQCPYSNTPTHLATPRVARCLLKMLVFLASLRLSDDCTAHAVWLMVIPSDLHLACQSRRCEYVGLEPTKTTQPPLVVLDRVLLCTSWLPSQTGSRTPWVHLVLDHFKWRVNLPLIVLLLSRTGIQTPGVHVHSRSVCVETLSPAY
mgnify:CR=1 FL=1